MQSRQTIKLLLIAAIGTFLSLHISHGFEVGFYEDMSSSGSISFNEMIVNSAGPKVYFAIDGTGTTTFLTSNTFSALHSLVFAAFQPDLTNGNYTYAPGPLELLGTGTLTNNITTNTGAIAFNDFALNASDVTVSVQLFTVSGTGTIFGNSFTGAGDTDIVVVKSTITSSPLTTSNTVIYPSGTGTMEEGKFITAYSDPQKAIIGGHYLSGAHIFSGTALTGGNNKNVFVSQVTLEPLGSATRDRIVTAHTTNDDTIAAQVTTENNTYVAINFVGNMTLSNGAGFASETISNYDSVIIKIDNTTGAIQATKVVNTSVSEDEFVLDIAVDSDENVYVASKYTGATPKLVISKYDSGFNDGGEEVPTATLTFDVPTANINSVDMYIHDGHLYVAGGYHNNFILTYTGGLQKTVGNNGNYDNFIIRMNSGLDIRAHTGRGAGNNDQLHHIYVDSYDSMLVGGTYETSSVRIDGTSISDNNSPNTAYISSIQPATYTGTVSINIAGNYLTSHIAPLQLTNTYGAGQPLYYSLNVQFTRSSTVYSGTIDGYITGTTNRNINLIDILNIATGVIDSGSLSISPSFDGRYTRTGAPATTTIDTVIPSAVTLSTPSSGNTTNSLTSTGQISFGRSTGSDTGSQISGYTLQISTTGTMSNVYTSTVITGTSTSLVLSTGTYYRRVITTDNAGLTNTSAIQSFSIAQVTVSGFTLTFDTGTVNSGDAINFTAAIVNNSGNAIDLYTQGVTISVTGVDTISGVNYSGITLPASGSYTYTSGDNGSHYFTGMIIPYAGIYDVTVQDATNSGRTGTGRVTVIGISPTFTGDIVFTQNVTNNTSAVVRIVSYQSTQYVLSGDISGSYSGTVNGTTSFTVNLSAGSGTKTVEAIFSTGYLTHTTSDSITVNTGLVAGSFSFTGSNVHTHNNKYYVTQSGFMIQIISSTGGYTYTLGGDATNTLTGTTSGSSYSVTGNVYVMKPDGAKTITVTFTSGAIVYTSSAIIYLDTNIANNDDFADRISLGSTSAVTKTLDNLFTTTEISEPAHAGRGPYRSVRWKRTAPNDGALTVTTSGSEFDTVLAIYTGTTMTGLTLVTGNDDINTSNGQYQSQVIFTVTSGTTYNIAVGGYNNDKMGDITLKLTFDANEVSTFSFTDKTNASTNKYYMSNEITITGLNSGDTALATLDIGALYINSKAVGQTGNVKSGDKVKIELLSSDKYDTQITATLKIGTKSATYSIETEDADRGDADDFDVDISDKKPDVGDELDITIEVVDDDNDTVEDYTKKVDITVEMKDDDGDWDEVDDGDEFDFLEDDDYTFETSDEGKVKLEDWIEFNENGTYKIIVTENDDDDIEGSVTIYVGNVDVGTALSQTKKLQIAESANMIIAIYGNNTTKQKEFLKLFTKQLNTRIDNLTDTIIEETDDTLINIYTQKREGLTYMYQLITDYLVNNYDGYDIEITYKAPNGKPYTLYQDASRGYAWTAEEFVKAAYFPTKAAVQAYINKHNPIGSIYVPQTESDIINTPNGRVYLVEKTANGGRTSPDLLFPKAFGSYAELYTHIIKHNQGTQGWSHTLDTSRTPQIHTAPNGKRYTIKKTTDGRYTASEFTSAKYFRTWNEITNHINAHNQ